MKIVYINGSRIPTEKAHGFQMGKMCAAFARSGVEIELWVPRRFNHIKQDTFEYYDIERSFKVKKIPCIDFIIFDKILGPLAFWLTQMSFLLFVALYILRDGTDIIYTRDKFVVLLLSLFKKNIFYEAHTVPAGIFFWRIKKTKGIITITQHLKNIFVDQEVEANKILVDPDGVDISEFEIPESKEQCRKMLGISQDQKIVLYTGHLYKWKGVNVLLKAYRYLPSNTMVYIVGGTEKDFSNIKCQISNVKLIGHRLHREIPYWLRAADVLVLPNSGKYYISKYWTSPMKLFEYMAARKPIVASDLPSIREILGEKNSILVKSDDPEDLARGIKKILEDKKFAEEISAKAFLDVKSYTWEKRARRILNFMAS